MSFLQYDGYKDSGVEWLDGVPKHWRIASLRHGLAEIFNGLTVTQVDPGEGTVPVTRIETISAGVIDEKKLGYIPASEAREDRRLQVGDILFSNINSLNMIGNCAVYLGGGAIYAGMNLLVLRPSNDVGHEWLAWVIRCPLFRQTVESLAKPAINQASISQGSLLSILIVTPPIAEQSAIAAFLDRETAKIDALVEAQQGLIKLLKEKRQAVISHAVTKGLDPKVPMKDSGVEWLGEVPEHWVSLPLKRVATLITGITPPTDDPYNYKNEPGYPWVRPEDLDETGLPTKASRFLSDVGWGLVRRVRPDATLVCCIGTIGKVGFSSDVVSTNQQITAAEFASRHRYSFYTLIAARGELEVASTGNVLRILNSERLGRIVVPQPPESEATAIADFLDRETAKIDQLVGEAEAAIVLLQERRAALITAAVTGKIDVRGLVGADAQIADVIAA